MRQRRVIITVAAITVSIVAWWLIFAENPRARAERVHGIKLPPFARNIQCKGDPWYIYPDHDEVTLFEMAADELPGFLTQLSVNSRHGPVRTVGDPAVNGHTLGNNIWPIGVQTSVPGNAQYQGFQATWRGQAVPVEMLSCASPTGDWLHVEYWKLEGGGLIVKMCTDWN